MRATAAIRALTKRDREPALLIKVGMFAVPLIVAVVLFGRMLSPEDQFYVDWVNSYWLSLTADPGVWPLWFFAPISGVAALEPWYAYYGGYWFYLMASVREIGIDALLLYRISYLFLSLGMAGGVYYLAVRGGVAVWAAALLASVALAIPYYLTNAYGRGAYTEFVFVSLLPVLIAGSVAFFSARRLWQAIVLAILVTTSATLVLTTHMASLIILFDLALAVVALAAFTFLFLLVFRPQSLREVQFHLRRQQRSVLALVLLLGAAGFLAAPQIGAAVVSASGTYLGSIDKSCFVPKLSALPELFALTPRVNEGAGDAIDLKPQTITWLAVWVIVASMGSWPSISVGRRIALLLSLMLFGFCVAMASSFSLCMALPEFMTAYQFPYRFASYVSLSLILVGGVLLSSSYLRSGSGALRAVMLGLFIAVALATVTLGVIQARSAATYPKQSQLAAINPNELPPTWYAPTGSFRQVGDLPDGVISSVLIEDQTSYRVVGSIQCSGVKETIIDIADSRPLSLVSGVKVVGSTKSGLLVVDTSSCNAGEFLRITVEQASERGTGRWLTLVALLSSLVLVSSAVLLRRSGGEPRSEQIR